MQENSWLKKLQNRWQVNSLFQVIVILIVFTCTGFTIVFLKHLLGISKETPMLWRIVFYIAVLPIYNIILLFYGTIFGQKEFFLNFIKRFFSRFIKLFKKIKKP